LVASNDGVGTKVLVAIETGIHKSIGIDLVAMSVNDILSQGAEPLFFLDYIATAKINLKITKDIIKGIVKGCRQSECALIGGETAEMPGLYKKNDYDLAGFALGVAERNTILPRKIKAGDLVIGFPSSGFHSNGYSLIRKVISKSGWSYENPSPFNKNKSIGELILTPTKIYNKPCLSLTKRKLSNGFAHITGGGLIENIPRILPRNLSVELSAQSIKMPKIMKWIAQEGNISHSEMARTFNCGIGMVAIIAKKNETEVIRVLEKIGEKAHRIGFVKNRKNQDRQIEIKDMNVSW